MNPAPVTATGHLVGGVYSSADHHMTYVVVRVATLWECAPDGAVLIRWENGNEVVTARPAGRDVLVDVPWADEADEDDEELEAV
jgi:hypothetical protein